MQHTGRQITERTAPFRIAHPTFDRSRQAETPPPRDTLRRMDIDRFQIDRRRRREWQLTGWYLGWNFGWGRQISHSLRTRNHRFWARDRFHRPAGRLRVRLVRRRFRHALAPIQWHPVNLRMSIIVY